MAQRILKNNTASAVPINDVGQTVPASGQLVINPIDYGKYEGSSDVIVVIGDSTLTVNDGTFDLSITDGTRLIQGGFSRPISDGANPTIKASVKNNSPGPNELHVTGQFSEAGGSTLQYSDSVDTLGIVYPNPADKDILEFLIHVPEEQEVDHRLLVSMDGSNFITLKPSGHLAWTPKGPIKQLTIKSNTNAGVSFELILNLGTV